MRTNDPYPADAAVVDISLLSVNMSSAWPDLPQAESPSFSAEASVGLDDPTSSPAPDKGFKLLSATISVTTRAVSSSTQEEVFSANLEIGCTVVGRDTRSEEDLWGFSIDAALGFARTFIHALSTSSAIKEGFYIPLSSGADLICSANSSQQDAE